MRTRRSKLITLFLVGSVFALVVLVSDRPVPVPHPPEPELPRAVVTMGDSTISGEGAGDYLPGTDGRDGNWCHRSSEAVIHQLDLPSEVKRFNLACSGARAGTVGLDPGTNAARSSQAAELARLAQRYRITEIVVAVGANDDPDFVGVLNSCVQAWISKTPGGCSKRLRSEWPERVEDMRPKVGEALTDIKDVMRRAGYTRDSYSLVLQSYASPVGPGIRPDLHGLSGCPLRDVDVRWVRNTAVPRLSAGLREVAERQDVRFLDLSRAGHGHEACTAPDESADTEWFRRLAVDWKDLEHEKRASHAMQESFHPNATGYARIAGCLDEFLSSERRQAGCLPDGEGALRMVPIERVTAEPTSRGD
ncbi:GDSL-like Lipase/Acylhydrolase family protein [Actinopolyspora xinjiangensis]|uniref:GDSL-like Lipase/Acylhydrolase family protein n=1 Tax=Actinopolyspora xinjiangensis TaxID=405564 RepID=A0A1H0WJ05_9ACTN|nr:GDSL-type esterase/lipase family protein [Actinopolyspora xinjiangensis]SDP90720.1 GDSL-like Lipase/Acylhydrolase family protein [Actinopolyspora xinjiangensis]